MESRTAFGLRTQLDTTGDVTHCGRQLPPQKGSDQDLKRVGATTVGGRIVAVAAVLSVSFDSMDSGTIDRKKFALGLRHERGPVWVKAIVGPTRRRRAPLYVAQVFVGPEPPGWTEATWNYESCTFVAAR